MNSLIKQLEHWDTETLREALVNNADKICKLESEAKRLAELSEAIKVVLRNKTVR